MIPNFGWQIQNGLDQYSGGRYGRIRDIFENRIAGGWKAPSAQVVISGTIMKGFLSKFDTLRTLPISTT